MVGSRPTGLSLSAGGVLAVATGTTAGTYAVNYQICQATVPSNCATATATAVVPAVGTVSGRAIDANTGAGVAGVTVSAGAVQTTTDASGNFSLGGLAVADRQPVVFTSTTHAESVRVATVRTGSSTDVQARLQPVGASAAVDVAAGGSVSVTGSTARVTLPADGVQRSDGSVPSGNMTVRLTAINPGIDSTLMPGDFTTLVSGTAAPIESFGAINVALSDSAGSALNLRSGRSAVIRIPVGSRNGSPPSTIPLFYFDNASGRWVQEGTATLVGSGTSAYYEGTVTHFSTWNADQVYNTVRITGCVADAAGLPVSGAQVVSDGVDYSGTSNATTDASGQFVLSMRKDSTATLVAVSNGLLTNTLRVGPYSSDASLPTCLALGQTGAGVTMKLTWGLAPRDLDSHIVTPSGTEVYFGSKGNLLLAPFTNLDVDDTSSYGPEVVTLTKLMVGTYKYWVHNYSGFSAGSITASGARVELNVPGRSLELFVPPTTGETASTPVWNLFELDVDAQCRVTVRRTGTFSNAAPARTSGTPVYCTAP
ncbi:MAG: hypothetical protein CFE45_03635 [Burkholderiales bacterium PBB5]|nr:MAG: hypothetical protein CFE45_03635 [Burkholderiales bacterium PBB5]